MAKKYAQDGFHGIRMPRFRNAKNRKGALRTGKLFSPDKNIKKLFKKF